MGGDRAPEAVIAGVQLYATEFGSSDLCLLGDEQRLKSLLARFRGEAPRLIHCAENIEMGESPVKAVRAKRESSIVKGLQLAAETPDSAFFSAGHSGAVFAAALMAMGRVAGVERPAIATVLPTLSGHSILLDAGANVDVRPNHLADFARMGSIYASVYLRHENPTVGLLSNGEEESKGTDLTRAANAALKEVAGINYIGYVEGKEIFDGEVDVVVTDGFTGNVVLKSLEGLGRVVASIIRSELKANLFSKLGAIFSMPALRQVQRKLDYAEVGSAPLLGVDGNCFIGHGRSNARAIKNGILRAREAVDLKLHEQLRAQFKGTA
jgi:glycerol-3-phosphate acyltransferase PlsX